MVNWERLVVVKSSGATVDLSNYKTQVGGTGAAGWAKRYFSANGTDASELIASLLWVLGGNLFCSSWYDTTVWYAGTFGYTNTDTITTDAASTTTITVKALDENENVIGTIFTLTISKDDQGKATIVDLVITGLEFNLTYAADGVDGEYTGPANAILVDIAWSSSVTTDGDPPIVGGASATVTPYLNVSKVSA